VQALSKEQETLNIHLPDNGKNEKVFKIADKVKNDNPYLEGYREKFKKKVEGEKLRVSIIDFKIKYSQLLEIGELIQINPEDATKSKVKEILDSSLVSEQLLIDLFNILIIEYSLNEKPEYIDLITTSIKVVATIQNLDTLRTRAQIVEYFNDSKVILPKEIFPIQKEPIDLSSSKEVDNYGESQQKEKEILDKIDLLITTRELVENCFNEKINTKRNEEKTLEEFCSEYNQELQYGNNKNDGTNIEYTPCETAYNKYLENKKLDYIDIKCINNDFARKLISDLGFKQSNSINAKQLLLTIDKKIAELSSKIESKVLTNKIVKIGNSIISVNQDAFEKQICGETIRLSHCELLKEIRKNIPDESLVQILGVGHHQVIRDEHKKYVSTLLAHNEPILGGEEKINVYRNLKRTEIYSETETEREEENSTDTKTTDSFELGKEIEKESSQNSDFDAGVKVTANYGTAKIEASANYATKNANKEKTKSSMKSAKETVSRSINKVKEKVRELRTSKTINEIEQTITHTIDNKGKGNNNGWYQYIDEVREFGVYDVGLRTILRIHIPVPAAFDVFAASQAVPEGISIEKPIHPKEYESSFIRHLKSYKDISRHNYGYWAAVYDAQDIQTPPEEFLTVSKAFNLDYQQDDKMWHSYAQNDLTLKDGYEAFKGRINIALSGGAQYVSGYLGNNQFTTYYGSRRFNFVLSGQDNTVALSYRGYHNSFSMNVEIDTKLTTQKYDEWRLSTFNSIMNAYYQKKAEYDNQMSILDIQEGIKIEGRNPRINRKIIDTALERGCIDMLTKGGYRGYETVKYARTGEPETDYAETKRQIPFLSFFENAFEWHNKTYVFKPWFWDSYPRWKTLMQFSDPDMLFQNFIQAGAAIVDLPIRPEYTEAVLHFISTGEIWEFENMPTLDDPMYLSIIQMIKDSQKQTDGVLVGEKWEETIPTSEVIVKDLPDNLK
ncbi:MAG: hypothetical protein KDC67_06775, partial [Ignavibacteriae bacterium]|nr:hypothetical protein [Ignavibacteriota bacterium]